MNYCGDILNAMDDDIFSVWDYYEPIKENEIIFKEDMKEIFNNYFQELYLQHDMDEDNQFIHKNFLKGVRTDFDLLEEKLFEKKFKEDIE